MRKIALAAAAVLSLWAGASYAASNGPGSTVPMRGQQVAPVSVAPAPTMPQSGSSDVMVQTPGANPWQGTESWKQWNEDHPDVGSD